MRVAILIKGAVSKVSGKFNLPGQLYREGEYINYRAVYNSIVKHIVTPNPDCDFDFFIHSWNTDLEESLSEVYNPVAARYDDNNLFKEDIIKTLTAAGCEHSCFALTSHALSIKLGCELIEQYVDLTGDPYDLVIFYRPDIMMWKDMKLSNYDKEAITLDNWQDFRGEMHFVMNYQNMIRFKGVYDSISPSNPPKEHCLFNNFLLNVLKANVQQDDIVAGVDEAPVRYIHHQIVAGAVSMETLMSYGFSQAELESYVNIY
jgi:hypothetical protein